MKGNILCVSQASTAICISHMDHIHPSSAPPSSSLPASSSSSSASIQYGGKAIDRHNPIIRDSRRPTLSTPCSSSPHAAINPTPYHQLQKTSKKKTTHKDQKRKKSTSSVSSSSVFVSKLTADKKHPDRTVTVTKKNRAPELITPPGSSRYLLSEIEYVAGLSDLPDPVVFGSVPVQEPKLALVVLQEETEQSSVPPKPPSSSARFKSPSDQVVVLRVSLHCKGCEGKVRKHISRMEGVSSFNIDFKAKKVTINGDVTPLSVLASVSKVKAAQFWTSTAPLDGNKK